MFTLSLGHCPASRRRAEPATLAVGAAVLGLTALVLAVPFRPAVSPVQEVVQPRPVVTLLASGQSLPALRDAAETVRARLLALPGVGAVESHGLLTTGLEVDYAPAALRRRGVTPDDIRAALPAQAREAASGHIAIPLGSVQGGPQPIADRIVRAGGRAFRLGDIATVARVGIDPVSVLKRDGRPAVELEIVPSSGTTAASLDRLVAAKADGMAPQGFTVR